MVPSLKNGWTILYCLYASLRRSQKTETESDNRRKTKMKYVKEIVIMFGITRVGVVLNMFIPLPVPAGVYGLFILLGGLCTKVISLSDVEVPGNLLLDLMPVMFIPAAVGIIDKIEELRAIMIPMLIITFVTTFIVMTITGKTAEWIIKRQKKREK